MTGARLAITSILPWVSLSLALLSPNTGRIVAADPDAAPADAWPMARGSLAGTGRSASTLRLPLAEAWRRDFDKTAFAAGPVIAGGVVYIGDLDGDFHALDLATGEPRWTRRIDGAGFTSAAAVAADPALPLVVGDDMGTVRGLDRATGETRWDYATEGEISGGPTILADGVETRVLVGSQDASLSCLDLATGKLVWKHSIADQIRCAPTVARTPAGDRVFLAGCDGRLHILDAATGEPAWEFEAGGGFGAGAAVAAGRVVIASDDGTVWCFRSAE
jgi:outer membrane protein assembly factor BamB